MVKRLLDPPHFPQLLNHVAHHAEIWFRRGQIADFSQAVAYHFYRDRFGGVELGALADEILHAGVAAGRGGNDFAILVAFFTA